MAEVPRNGKGMDAGSGTDRTADDVRDAVDLLIGRTLGIMDGAGGEAVAEDREPLLRDLVEMFDERMRAGKREAPGAESAADSAGARLETLQAARDRAAEWYRRETGRTWERATG